MTTERVLFAGLAALFVWAFVGGRAGAQPPPAEDLAPLRAVRDQLAAMGLRPGTTDEQLMAAVAAFARAHPGAPPAGVPAAAWWATRIDQEAARQASGG